MSDPNDIQADVLLVTVNPFETKAVLAAFKSATGKDAMPVSLDERVYRNLGLVNGMKVFHALSEMGTSSPGAAQQAVDRGIRALKPKAVIAVGIAFGIDDKKQKIGDILISSQLRLYDLQRVGREIILRGDKPHASPSLINFLSGVAQTSWRGAPVRVGLMLSGEKLVDSPDFRQELVRLEPEAIGGEMEGAGLYVASYDHKVDWIVAKAICDWADGNKAKRKVERQKLAAKNSAEFIAHAFMQVPFTGQSMQSSVSVPAGNSPPRVDNAQRERLRPVFETLSRCFQSHRAMMAGHLTAILNKLPLKEDGSFEAARIEMDEAVFSLMPTLTGLIPPPLERTIRRLRVILSCPWEDPKDIYYTLLEKKKVFPREPVEAVAVLYDDLMESYREMTYLFFEGIAEQSAYLECLHRNHLDDHANTTRTGVYYRVARAMILVPDSVGSRERARALEDYASEDEEA